LQRYHVSTDTTLKNRSSNSIFVSMEQEYSWTNDFCYPACVCPVVTSVNGRAGPAPPCFAAQPHYFKL
jgi:hypothetical protein